MSSNLILGKYRIEESKGILLLTRKFHVSDLPFFLRNLIGLGFGIFFLIISYKTGLALKLIIFIPIGLWFIYFFGIQVIGEFQSLFKPILIIEKETKVIKIFTFPKYTEIKFNQLNDIELKRMRSFGKFGPSYNSIELNFSNVTKSSAIGFLISSSRFDFHNFKSNKEVLFYAKKIRKIILSFIRE